MLGPAGAWWLKDRVDGKVDILFNHRVRSGVPHEDGVRLTLDGPCQEVFDVDHVIAGTHNIAARLAKFLIPGVSGSRPEGEGVLAAPDSAAAA